MCLGESQRPDVGHLWSQFAECRSNINCTSRLITPATSTLEVDIFQAAFLLQHKPQLAALQNLHGVDKLEYQNLKKPCYRIEGPFADAVAAARNDLEKLATVLVSKPFNVNGIPSWLLQKTVVAWTLAHHDIGSCWNDDQTELRLVSQDEDGLATAQQEMTAILKNIEDATKKVALTQQQCRILIGKATPEFQKAWDVSVRVDLKASTVTLLGDSPDTTEAAWDALKSFLENTQMSSLQFVLPQNSLLGLYVKKTTPGPVHPLNIMGIFKKIVLAQNKRVHVSESSEDKKESVWLFKGTEKAASEALEEAKSKIAALERDMGQKIVEIDSWKADGLLSNSSRIRKVMQKTSTFVDLEGGDNRVLLALQTATGHKIQIKRGDISTVTSDAIVNAANSQLSHGSGVALSLAQAAGPEMQDACTKSIATNGPVRTGTARVTIPGNQTRATS